MDNSLSPGLHMKTFFNVMLVLVAFFVTVTHSAMGQQKLAQTGMKFLAVANDARAAALGEALTSVEGASSSMFFNPASMARLGDLTNASGGYTQWIADIKHYYGSVAFSPWGGEYGVIGFFVQSVDYGNFEETVRSNNDQGYLDLGTFKPTAVAAGAGYARALSDKFSVGGNVKYVRQSLGDATTRLDPVTNAPIKESNTASAFAFDFGILYRTGFKSLNFGMTVRNFSKEVQYQKEGFQLPLTFKIGLSMNVLDLADIDRDVNTFLLTVDAEHPRDYQEQIKVGGEYTYLNTLAFRFGYIGPADEQSYSLGVGVRHKFETFGFAVDYAYTPFGIFNNVNRISFQFSF
jgi:hypothetical protein